MSDNEGKDDEKKHQEEEEDDNKKEEEEDDKKSEKSNKSEQKQDEEDEVKADKADEQQAEREPSTKAGDNDEDRIEPADEAEEKPTAKKKKGLGAQLTHCFRRKKKTPEGEKAKGAKPAGRSAVNEKFYGKWNSYEVEPGMRTNVFCQEKGELISTIPDQPEVTTLWSTFQHGLEISPNGNCAGWLENFKVYKWYSYSDVASKVRAIAASMKKLGLERQSKIGVYSKPVPGWTLASLSILSRSCIIVPLYDTLGKDSCEYIINQVEMPMMFADSEVSVEKMLDIAEQVPTLKYIVMFDEPSEDLKSKAKSAEVTLVTLEDFISGKTEAEDSDSKKEGEENEAFDGKEDDEDKKSQKSGEGEEDKKSEKEEEEDKKSQKSEGDKDEKKEEEEEDKKSAKGDDDEAEEADKKSQASEDDVYDLPEADDTAMIQYTSGTTGFPKGVVLTHKNMIATISALVSCTWNDLGKGLRFTKNEVALLYLPMAHVYGFAIHFFMIYCGASLGYYSGDPKRIKDAAAVLKPTVMTLVPRLMNRLMSVVMGEINKSGSKKKMFAKAYAKKKAMYLKGQISRTTMWDKIVFKKVQAVLGGRIWFITCGSAPISADVLEWFRVVFGAVVWEGYGQTESGGVISATMGPFGGNVGHPFCHNYVKLVDVPDSDYLASEGKGEICAKGDNILKEYFMMPEKTAEAIDEEGWLHTGDIGQWLEDGSLKIIDRKKHLFKLAQGEYIAPEKIESVYAMVPRVAQVYVDGDSLESYVVAIVSPDEVLIAQWAEQNNTTASEAITNADYIKLVLDDLLAKGKEQKLNSLEQVKSIHLTDVVFSVDNDLLTPTMKNKRPQLRKFFKEQIDALYQAGPMVGAEGGATSKS